MKRFENIALALAVGFTATAADIRTARAQNFGRQVQNSIENSIANNFGQAIDNYAWNLQQRQEALRQIAIAAEQICDSARFATTAQELQRLDGRLRQYIRGYARPLGQRETLNQLSLVRPLIRGCATAGVSDYSDILPDEDRK